MDSFRIHKLKPGKSRGISRFVSNALRITEVLVCLILISKFSTRLPAVARISGEYFREFTLFLMSPCFVFFLGNAIIITLFAKSSTCFPDQIPPTKASSFDLYEEFVEKSEKKHETQLSKGENRGKQSIPGDNRNSNNTKSCRRTLSENFRVVRYENNSGTKLRRSDTVKDMGISHSHQESVKGSFQEDNMTNEEFRSKIESFIARQKMLQLDEDCL